jgi:hypothetical protein
MTISLVQIQLFSSLNKNKRLKNSSVSILTMFLSMKAFLHKDLHRPETLLRPNVICNMTKSYLRIM